LLPFCRCNSKPFAPQQPNQLGERHSRRTLPIAGAPRKRNRNDAKLLDQVLIKFYWLRAQSELRMKPSTSELIDWISALLRPGMSMGKLEAHIPFTGALLKTEQDVDALGRFDQKGGRYPSK
jgi:hypothetical protein